MTTATSTRSTTAPRPSGTEFDAEFARVADKITRRGLLAGAVGTAALIGLGGCSGGGAPAAAPSSVPHKDDTTTVRHKYGTTTLPNRPQRVVTLGYTDQEPVLALGVRPVGVVDFFGERPYGNWPWEKSLWEGSEPEIVGNRDDYNFEKIAALRPDLIIGFYSAMTSQNYDTLSKIAPTVAQPLGYADFAAPWPVMTELAGRSLGRQQEAQKLVADIQAQFTTVRQAHPEWTGKTIAIAEPGGNGQWAVFGAGDPKLQFVEGLGFTVAPAVRQLEPGGDVATITDERLDLLDVDRLILLIDTGDPTQAQVEANPLYNRLAVARQNRTLFLPFSTPPPVGAALAFDTVLSIPYGIQHIVPALSAG